MPELLPSQCESSDGFIGRARPEHRAAIHGGTGLKKIPSFSNWSPRVSATYDLFGNGKTSIHASYSFYYETKITLANCLGGLFDTTSLTWGTNQSSGSCATDGGPCWTDANLDGIVQSQRADRHAELQQQPVQPGHRHPHARRATRSIRTPKLSRTREFVTGDPARADPEPGGGRGLHLPQVRPRHDELHGRLPARVRRSFPLSQIYTGPLSYTDPVDAD